MRLPFIERAPGHEARTFAEAQALIDDGLDRDLVLSLFPDDATWLPALLGTSQEIREAIRLEPPSYYFEASLKAKFLAAAASTRPVAVPIPANRFRTAVASMGVAAVGGIMSMLTLGFLTSSGSVPGDWNYTLKRANERIQYTLSPRDSRLNLQIDHTETRIRDLQVRTLRGQVSPGDIQRLEQEARDLTELVKAQGQPLEEAQKAKVKVIVDTGTAVLDDAKAKKADLEPSTASATTQLQEVYAAAVGPVTPIKSSPTAAPSSTATSAATATATATAASSPTPAPPTSATEAKPTETKPAETKPPATPDPSPASTAGAAQTTTPPATSTP